MVCKNATFVPDSFVFFDLIFWGCMFLRDPEYCVACSALEYYPNRSLIHRLMVAKGRPESLHPGRNLAHDLVVVRRFCVCI